MLLLGLVSETKEEEGGGAWRLYGRIGAVAQRFSTAVEGYGISSPHTDGQEGPRNIQADELHNNDTERPFWPRQCAAGRCACNTTTQECGIGSFLVGKRMVAARMEGFSTTPGHRLCTTSLALHQAMPSGDSLTFPLLSSTPASCPSSLPPGIPPSQSLSSPENKEKRRTNWPYETGYRDTPHVHFYPRPPPLTSFFKRGVL